MRTRWLPVLALAVLAPVCAEYLWGYDDSTGHPGTLVGNLIVFTPLYGCPALLIREVARRRGLGWPGIVLLAAAFGVVEAGLVDQSMFSPRLPRHPVLVRTWPTRRTSRRSGSASSWPSRSCANHVHRRASAGPIALVEGLAGSARPGPWLGRPMIVVAALLYAGGLGPGATPTCSTPRRGHRLARPAGRVRGVAAALLVAAVPLRIGVAGPPTRRAGAARARGWSALAAFVVGLGSPLLPPSPLGTDALVADLRLGGRRLVWWLSGRPGWSTARTSPRWPRRAERVRGRRRFWTDPIGDVTDAEKLGHNIALLAARRPSSASSRYAGRQSRGARRVQRGRTLDAAQRHQRRHRARHRRPVPRPGPVRQRRLLRRRAGRAGTVRLGRRSRSGSASRRRSTSR